MTWRGLRACSKGAGTVTLLDALNTVGTWSQRTLGGWLALTRAFSHLLAAGIRPHRCKITHLKMTPVVLRQCCLTCKWLCPVLCWYTGCHAANWAWKLRRLFACPWPCRECPFCRVRPGWLWGKARFTSQNPLRTQISKAFSLDEQGLQARQARLAAQTSKAYRPDE